MTSPEEKLALTLAEMRLATQANSEALADLQDRVAKLSHQMQETVDICRGCPGFGFDNEELP